MHRALESHEGLAQVVKLHRSRLEPAVVEIAIILRTPGGGYTLRRLLCSGEKAMSARDHLFDPDPEILVQCGAPSTPGSVQDRRFATLAAALWASGRQDPAADQGKWMNASEFREKFPPAGLGPKAEDVGPLGYLVTLAGGLAAVAGVLFVLGVLLDLLGAGSGKEWGDLWVAVVLLLGVGGVVYAGAILMAILRSRNRPTGRDR